LALRPGGCLYLGSCVNTKSGGCWWLGWSRSNSVNVITEYALGRRVLPVNADACGELAQRRGLASFGGQQVGDHRTHQGLVAYPVRCHALRGQQQRQGLVLL